MKRMTCRMLGAIVAIGLCTDLLAVDKRDYAQIALSNPGGGTPLVGPDEFIILVIEGPNISYDTNPIPASQVVDYVNKLLEVKKVSYIGVCTREGTKYGDVVRAMDLLRGTKAKNIGLSMKELPLGREL